MPEITQADENAAMKFLVKLDGVWGAYCSALAKAFAEHRETAAAQALMTYSPSKTNGRLPKIGS
jgi:hypothetical protein